VIAAFAVLVGMAACVSSAATYRRLNDLDRREQATFDALIDEMRSGTRHLTQTRVISEDLTTISRQMGAATTILAQQTENAQRQEQQAAVLRERVDVLANAVDLGQDAARLDRDVRERAASDEARVTAWLNDTPVDADDIEPGR
jgi:hypothetical protein